MKEQIVDGKKWALSTEGYYFKYRYDVHDPELLRADLYHEKNDQRLESIRVGSGYGFPHKTHHQVINAFEVMVTF